MLLNPHVLHPFARAPYSAASHCPPLALRYLDSSIGVHIRIISRVTLYMSRRAWKVSFPLSVLDEAGRLSRIEVVVLQLFPQLVAVRCFGPGTRYSNFAGNIWCEFPLGQIELSPLWHSILDAHGTWYASPKWLRETVRAVAWQYPAGPLPVCLGKQGIAR